MLRTLSAVALLAVGATLAYAQSAAISQRKDAMKSNVAAIKDPGAMIKGDMPFDLAVTFRNSVLNVASSLMAASAALASAPSLSCQLRWLPQGIPEGARKEVTSGLDRRRLRSLAARL